MKKIIAICGHEGSGKSTTARFLASALDRRGYKVKIVSFASPLKELCKVHLGFDKTNRDAMEEFAMDIRRILGNDIFTQATMKEINDSSCEYFIIDDFRYIHELEYLHSSEHMTHILQTRDIVDARSMDDTRLEELKTFMKINSIDTVTLPNSYDELYRFTEKFVELVV